jgi:hypothetical protein
LFGLYLLTKITTTVRENRMDNQERTIHADTLASFETLFVKFDLYRISFYSGFGLDNELYDQFNNQTNSADDYIDCKITGSDVKLPVLHFFTKQKFEDYRWHKGPSWS